MNAINTGKESYQIVNQREAAYDVQKNNGLFTTKGSN